MTNTIHPAATKQTLLRFVLTGMGENLVLMHPEATVAYVQEHKKGVEIFALVAAGTSGFATNSDFPAGEPEPRRFYVAKTGETVQEMAIYRGTATLPTLKARHVFELV